MVKRALLSSSLPFVVVVQTAVVFRCVIIVVQDKLRVAGVRVTIVVSGCVGFSIFHPVIVTAFVRLIAGAGVVCVIVGLGVAVMVLTVVVVVGGAAIVAGVFVFVVGVIFFLHGG